MWDPVEAKSLAVDRPEYHTRPGHCFYDPSYIRLLGEKEWMGQSGILTRLFPGRRCGKSGYLVEVELWRQHRISGTWEWLLIR